MCSSSWPSGRCTWMSSSLSSSEADSSLSDGAPRDRACWRPLPTSSRSVGEAMMRVMVMRSALAGIISIYPVIRTSQLKL